MEAMNESERLDFLIRNLEGGSAIRFSEKTGIPQAQISRIKSGSLRLKSKYDKILAAYPLVNRGWLETGAGDPGDISVEVVRSRMMKAIEERDRMIFTLRREIELQQRIIEKKLI